MLCIFVIGFGSPHISIYCLLFYCTILFGFRLCNFEQNIFFFDCYRIGRRKGCTEVERCVFRHARIIFEVFCLFSSMVSGILFCDHSCGAVLYFVIFMEVVLPERMEFAIVFEVDGFGIY